ncbi:OmpH family outer membrane protein [Mucilaginibacter puniceus]
MRKLLKVALVALGVVFMSNFAQAQTKIGYIAMEQIIPLLPEFKTAQTVLTTAQNGWIEQINKLSAELQTKGKEYEAKRATMTEAVRSVTESELADLQKRGNDMQTKAQQDLEAKQAEQMAPLVTKIKTAISAVAKEKGYTYVLNTSSPELLLVAPPADDLEAAVKAKLNIK